MMSICCRALRRCCCMCLLGVLASTLAIAEPLTVVIPPWGHEADSQNAYFVKLLRLAFAKTEAAEGVVVLAFCPENLTGARFIADLKNNKTIDVIWHGTNLQREQELLAIPIPLTQTLNEYRLLLIRKEDQEKFSRVKSIDDLRKFTAGAGADWPSRNILLGNDLPVVSVANPSLLFTMLKMKRFDYMSRNMFEIWAEAERYAKDDLVVEKTLLLHGGVSFYFFVSRAKPQLAARIERGLRIAIADGDFEKLFWSEEQFKRGALELAQNKRQRLELSVH